MNSATAHIGNAYKDISSCTELAAVDWPPIAALSTVQGWREAPKHKDSNDTSSSDWEDL